MYNTPELQAFYTHLNNFVPAQVDGKRVGFSMNSMTPCDWKDTSGHECGTSMCISGHLCAFLGISPRSSVAKIAERLGLEDHEYFAEELYHLFYPDVEDRLSNYFYHEVNTQEAAKVLLHFMETGKADWFILESEIVIE